MSKTPYAKKGIKAGIIAGAIVLIGGFLVFRPGSLLSIGVLIAVSLGVGALIRVMAQGLDLEKKEKVPESIAKVKVDTGNSVVDEQLKRGTLMLLELDNSKKAIKEESLKQTIANIEDGTSEIFQAINEKPEKAGKIRKLLDYYLPTVLKMLQSYSELNEKQVVGKEVDEAKARIKSTLQAVGDGLDKLKKSIYRDDVLDITTEMDVMEQMLRRDGFTESDLELATKQAKDAAALDSKINEEMAKAKNIKNDAMPKVEEIPQVPTMDGGVYMADEAMAKKAN